MITRTSVQGLALIAILILACSAVQAQDEPQIGQHTYSFKSGAYTVQYSLFLPDTYGQDPNKVWPMIVFFHGFGMNIIDDPVGPVAVAAQRPDLPFVVMGLQPPFYPPYKHDMEVGMVTYFGGIRDMVLIASPVLDDVLNRYAIDQNRVYLSGGSYGGSVAWTWPLLEPRRFAAAVSMNGFADPHEDNFCAMRSVPIREIHVGGDFVPLWPSTSAAAQLAACGGEASFTILSSGSHQSPTFRWQHDEIYEWLLTHRRRPQQDPGYAIEAVSVTPAVGMAGRPNRLTITAVTRPVAGASGAGIAEVAVTAAGQPDTDPRVLRDDGVPPDMQASDGVYTGIYHVPAAAPQGRHDLQLELVDTQGQAYWFHQPFEIGPPEDYVIFADAWNNGWDVTRAFNVTVEPRADDHAWDGSSSLAFEASALTVDLAPLQAVSLAGYSSLRFAFHPGDATVGSRPALNVFLNAWADGRASLLDPESTVRVDLEQPEWQIIELPLDRFATRHDSLGLITVLGNLRGTFRIDDIRLVTAAQEPAPTAIGTRSEALPGQMSLIGNYPNPFNSGTVISFALPQPAEVELSLFNLGGQKVATLARGPRPAGTYTLQWDGRDDAGRDLASGAYLYTLTAGDRVETRKLLLLR